MDVTADVPSVDGCSRMLSSCSDRYCVSNVGGILTTLGEVWGMGSEDACKGSGVQTIEAL